MDKQLQRKYINLLSIVGILTILCLGYMSYLYLLKLDNASKWIIHSYEAIELTEEIMVDSYFAESGQRNYLLTGDKNYIVQLDDTFKRINIDASKLRKMVYDNPDQYARAINLSLLLKERIEVLESSTKLYNEQGLQASIKSIENGKSKILSDEIKQLCYEIIAEEKNLLITRSSAIYAHTFKLLFIKLIGTAFSLSLIIFCLWLLNRQLTLRIKAEMKILDSEDELIRVAYYDALTGLPNRTLLISKVDQLLYDLEYKKTIALLLIDIDHFKNINDSLTHDVGDELILSFSERLHTILSADDIISRIGADEFVVVTTIEQIQDLDRVAIKIINSFREALTVRSHKLFITVSIGISIYPNNGLDAKTLLKNADIAMYRAKELGRDNYQFSTPEMSLQVEERALLDYHLHQALQRDEFVLLYQPKVSLKDGKIIGIEALMRWNRPSIGLVFPENFIGLAESNGMIIPISEWLLRSVCNQGKKWQDQGLPIKNIAINISTRQFSISDFASNIKAILAETGFDPHYLEFEITERILMENSFNNFAALRVLKELGIKITIDDFGTGYSSLSYLRIFSIDKIKIDKSFIDEITMENKNANIVNAIIVMAHSLGITVVAEGVETTMQADILKSYGCDEVQGFLYNHPLSVDEIERLLSQH